MSNGNTTREVIESSDAPKAIGPYSQAIRANGVVYTSGQVAIDPANNTFIGGDVAAQTAQVLANLRAVLEQADSSLAQVVKTTVFLTTMDNFAAMNDVYSNAFGDAPPARSTIAVAALPLGALVEIECIALVGG